ncbi:hypothetical protein CAEBREN_09066 [Caenorhabditis brenneri]|uniref:G-protein coupled receptors family 1 profile domain-containing protein n=1 Tax=Caenorhabditis brenneri TaxID=135651 RepID=G0MDU3_CAEBE|nr:hypothetical protein CAEBREN_09066 [Caenorhabditis brenneri]
MIALLLSLCLTSFANGYFLYVDVVFVGMNLSTVFATPLIIQTTYVFCNKRNVQVVKEIVKSILRTVGLKNAFRNTTVQPITFIE